MRILPFCLGPDIEFGFELARAWLAFGRTAPPPAMPGNFPLASQLTSPGSVATMHARTPESCDSESSSHTLLQTGQTQVDVKTELMRDA